MQYRSRTDRVAFAVHAYVVAEGYKLEAVSDAAEQASSAGKARVISPVQNVRFDENSRVNSNVVLQSLCKAMLTPAI